MMTDDSKYSQEYNVIEANKEVMTLKDWLVTALLLCIPIANIVLLFIWAFTDDRNINLNKKNFAKAHLIIVGIFLGIYLIFLIFFFFIMMTAVAVPLERA